MNWPSITVVLPTFNRASILPGAIQDIMGGAIKPSELIIVDDCSTDTTPEVIARYARLHPEIVCIRNESNMGVVKSGNIGLAKATGHSVYFAADDDYIDHFCLLAHADQFRDYPDAGISFGDPASSRRRNRLNLSKAPCFFTPESLSEIGRKHFLLFGVCAFNTEQLKRIGGFDERFAWHADWAAAVMLAFTHGACYTPRPLTVWQVNPEGFLNSRKQDAQNKVVENLVYQLKQYKQWPLVKRSSALWIIPGILKHWRELNAMGRLFALSRSVISKLT